MNVAVSFIRLWPLLLVAACIAFFVWAIVRAVQTKNAGWAVLGTGIFLILVFAPAAVWVFSRASFSPAPYPTAAIHIDNDFNHWGEVEVLQPSIKRQEWVETAGNSSWISERSDSVSIQLRTPGPKGELVGYSGLEPTVEEADGRAKKSLENQLKALVQWELVKNQPGDYHHVQKEQTEQFYQNIDQVVQNFLRERISGPSSNVKRHEETVKLPVSGTSAYQVAIMTNIPSDWPSQAAQEVAEKLKGVRKVVIENRRAWGWTLFSSFILALVVFLLYSFLNAGTKGHFAWPLRLISVAAFILLCLGLLAIRGHLI